MALILYLIDLSPMAKNNDRHRKQTIPSEKIVKKILSNELGIPCQNIKIRRHPYGKPFLENKARHFSISFSKNMLLMATDQTPIGADIEYTKKINDIDSLINHFSPDEKIPIYQLENSEKLKAFYKLWVLKESYIKAIGKGLSSPLDSFYIKVEEKNASLIYANEKDLRWKFKIYSVSDGYISAICARNNTFPKNFIHLDINDLLST